MSLKPGIPLYISELNVNEHDGASVRIFGKLVEHDIGTCSLIIEHNNAQLQVNTELLDASIGLRVGSLYQFIGEISTQHNEMVLKPRIVRNIDGMDLKLYDQALKIMRQHLASFPS
eukprot:TRINITY_DN10638_c0_g1_i1.p1 TRINITY_DN10638_c0_g1~~TRINITY_DN10638_c0_g1_i1.p1  ORF type:complete len:116 (+),score=13.39 TRINITY_DN10638_c0_g1_i1:57-404(+)